MREHDRAEAREEHPAAARRTVAHDHAGQRRAGKPLVQLSEGGQAVEERAALQAGEGGGVAAQAEVLGVGAAEDGKNALGPGGQRRVAATKVARHPHHVHRAAAIARRGCLRGARGRREWMRQRERRRCARVGGGGRRR